LDHLQQREEHWAIVDLVGKGGRVRTVPVPDWVRSELDDWLDADVIDRGKAVPQSQQGWKGMGRRHHRKGGLAHREGICQKHWSREVGTARSASDPCPALPRFRRGIGADPVSLGARVGSNDCTLPWM